MGASPLLDSLHRWGLVALWLVALGLAGCAPGGGPAESGSTGDGGYAGSAPGATAPVSIKNIGSDTMVNLALAWAEAYMATHPQVYISVTGGGSGTGIAALINGTIPLANASRIMSPEEIQAARSKGFEPQEHTVALDAVAVVVNPVNPVDRLTLSQISDIYTGRIRRWKPS